jgi:hypothetical protein
MAKDEKDEARTEEAPKAAKGTPDHPAASANPDEVAGTTGSPNMLQTEGLNPIQAARVQGTPIDGALGSHVLGAQATKTPSRTERVADRAAADAAEAGKKSSKDED